MHGAVVLDNAVLVASKPRIGRATWRFQLEWSSIQPKRRLGCTRLLADDLRFPAIIVTTCFNRGPMQRQRHAVDGFKARQIDAK